MERINERKEALEKGLEKGEQRIIALTGALIKANRYDDLSHIEDPVFREKLFKEFGL